MKNKKELPKLGKKGTLAGLVLSFVLMITLVATFTFSQYQDNVEGELAELELIEEQNIGVDETGEEATENASDGLVIELPETKEETSEEVQEAEEAEAVESSSTAEENVADMVTSDNVINEVITTNESIASQAAFTEDTQMVWPVSGGLIMSFNMEEVVYFATLDQYKLNPAMIIDSEVGTEVLAGERGTVTSITTASDTGTTVTIDMGNGYTAIYGQLDELKITEGSYVEKGQVIGTLAEPTKYYSVEGCNLYFQLLKDGTAVDPLDYLPV